MFVISTTAGKNWPEKGAEREEEIHARFSRKIQKKKKKIGILKPYIILIS
jgi:hypothetical protein